MDVVGERLGSWQAMGETTLHDFHDRIVAGRLVFIFVNDGGSGDTIAVDLGIQDLNLLNWDPDDEAFKLVGRYNVWRPPRVVAAASSRLKEALESNHPRALEALRMGESEEQRGWGPEFTFAVAREFERLATVCEFLR